MNWISLSQSPCDYGEYTFLHRQNSIVSKNLGFGEKQFSVQGDSSQNASLCLRFLVSRMGRSGPDINLTDWQTTLGVLGLWIWVFHPGCLSLRYPSPFLPSDLIYRPALPHAHIQLCSFAAQRWSISNLAPSCSGTKV